jgi:MFS family permease
VVPVVPLYARAYGVPQSAIGLTIAIYGLARFLLNVPAGQLADRVGRRGTLAIGGLVTAAGNLLCGLAPDYFTFLAARFVAGAGAALVITVCQIVLADISSPERRGRTMAIFTSVFVFAVGIGPLPGGVLAELYGLAAPFYVFAALGTAAAAVAWGRVPETRPAVPSDGSRSRPLPSFGAQIRLLAVQRGFLLISLVSFSTFVNRTGALFNLIPVLGKERLELSTDQIGLALAVISVVALALGYPSGMLADRFGRKVVIVPAVMLNGLSCLLFIAAGSFGGFVAGCLAWALASGISSAAPGAYAADMAPAGMNAAAMSAYRMLSDLGYIVGPLVLGLLADLFGVDAALAASAALLVAAAALFGWLAPETYRRARPTEA